MSDLEWYICGEAVKILIGVFLLYIIMNKIGLIPKPEEKSKSRDHENSPNIGGDGFYDQ